MIMSSVQVDSPDERRLDEGGRQGRRHRRLHTPEEERPRKEQDDGQPEQEDVVAAPATCICPPKSRNFSVNVVLPASGCEIMANVLLLSIS